MGYMLMPFTVLGLTMLGLPQSTANADTLNDKWAGTWFTCEFAKSQTPPHENCAMFDDEGFRFSDGRFTYVRITSSDETACRGDKVGQCFRRDQPSIRITTQDRGELDLGEELIKITYLFCTQIFYFKDTEYYREIWPDEKRCFWARKRHFYMARFEGDITDMK